MYTSRRSYMADKENCTFQTFSKSSTMQRSAGYAQPPPPPPGRRSSVIKSRPVMGLQRRNTPLMAIDENVAVHRHTEIHVDKPYMDFITLVVKKSRQGFGFAVTGANPVTVSRVDVGSSAEQAGLRKGDQIVKINGQNVEQSQADNVARIVRNSEKQIVVDISRDEKISQPPVVLVQNGGSRADKRRHSLPGELTQTPHTGSDSGLDESMSCSGLSPYPMSSGDSGVESLEACGDDYGGPSGAMSASVTAQCVSDEIPRVDRQLQALGSQREYQRATERLHSLESKFSAEMHEGMRCYVKTLRDYIISPAEHATLFQNIEKLVDISDFHVSELQKHILSHYKYRDDVIHEVGSVYLPQVSLMSETYEDYCNGIKNAFRLLKELHQDAEFHTFIKEMSGKTTGLSLTQFIQRPLQHIKDLVLCLQQLAVNTSVDHYDYDQLKAVVEAFRRTCNKIQDYNQRRTPSCLSLASRSSRMSERSPKKSYRSRSSSPRKVYRPFKQPAMSHQRSPDRESSSSGSSRSTEVSRLPGEGQMHQTPLMVSIASVDAEVMDIQTRLIFPDYMPAFQLATGTRYMIYSGELMQFDGLLWNRTFVVLLSDLLIVTRPDDEDMLLVSEEPIILNNISHINVEGYHPCEFHVTAAEGRPGQKACELIFQAPSLDLKSTWVHVLEQRIHSCKTQQIVTEHNVV